MPKMPPKPCTAALCTAYATKNSRCDEHQRKAWAKAKGKDYKKDWPRQRQRALKRDNYMCVECLKDGVFINATEVDHINGSSNALSNLRSLCKQHHSQHTQQEALEGRAKRYQTDRELLT